MRASPDTARRISSDCTVSTAKSPIRAYGEASIPAERISPAQALATALAEKTALPCLRDAPSSRASATEKPGGSVSRWCTMSSPRARTWETSPGATGRPSSESLPSPVVTRPEQKRASVVLPAPFCPRSAWIFPASKPSETFLSASTAP